MILDGFTSIPTQATSAGAPIDAFQADALRTNDQLFERIAQALLSSPFIPNGTDGDPTGTDLDPRRFINANTIVVGAPKTVDQKVPLIWFARERIVINENINAIGKGAVPGETGDFGGSGGGTGGAACLMPFTNDVIVQNGAAATSLTPADAWKASRILLYLPYLIGGAGGPTTSGGDGGGVICLCAPVIEIRNGFTIDASGANGTAGGGGGGLVILIARQLINVNTGAPGNVLVNGGTAASAADNGGAGRIVALTYK